MIHENDIQIHEEDGPNDRKIITAGLRLTTQGWIEKIPGAPADAVEMARKRLVRDVWQKLYGDVHHDLVILATEVRRSLNDSDVNHKLAVLLGKLRAP